VPNDSNGILLAIAGLTSITLSIYVWVVIIRVLMSWVNPNPGNPVVQFLARLTDPALYHVRRIFPLSYAGVDFSPVILILLVVFLNDFIAFSIRGLPGLHNLNGLAFGMAPTGIVPIFFFCFLRMVQGFLSAYMIVVIVRAVLSFISPDPYNPIVRFVYGITEPVLYRVRSLFPFLLLGNIDLSPAVLFVAIILFNRYVINWLMGIVFQVLA
jgi:YggT family protein